MGFLDDTLRQLTQGSGKGSPDLAAVIQEIIVGRSQGGSQASAPQQQAEMPRANASAQAGGQAGAPGSATPASGGLSDLLAQLQAAGLDDIVRSWIGSGQNKPVQPQDLGDALGKRNVTQMADKAGCSQDDLLTQLSKALPTIIDKLTHDGRVPSQTEINQRLRG